MSERPAAGLSVYLSGIIAGIWVAFAWRNPANTYYLAPLLVAAAFPLGQRVKLGRLGRREAAWAGIGGLLNVFVATALLLVAGKFDGDALLTFWHPAVEALTFGLAGGLLGSWLAAVERPRADARR